MEYPIIFNGPMVRAILSGRKTQTRRFLRKPPSEDFIEYVSQVSGGTASSISGKETIWSRIKPNDILWVRETFACVGDNADDIHACPDLRVHAYYAADSVLPEHLKWRPSIHMPRWASRIQLRVTDVRTEHLNTISEQDALAEGCKTIRDNCYVFEGTGYDKFGLCHSSAVTAFSILWDNIYKGTWNMNPEIVVIKFEIANPEIILTSVTK